MIIFKFQFKFLKVCIKLKIYKITQFNLKNKGSNLINKIILNRMILKFFYLNFLKFFN